jgi:hypothetical protein
VQRLSVLLDRFRRTAGVPAAVGDALEAELEPVFASLEEIEVEASRVREEATADATRRLDEAEAQSARIAAGGKELAERERAWLTAEVREASEQEARRLLAAARAEAERVRIHGQERVPELVNSVLACVRRSGV